MEGVQTKNSGKLLRYRLRISREGKRRRLGGLTMSVFDICSDDDAVRALLAPESWRDVRFVGWPKLVVDTSEPFHPMRNLLRLQGIQEAVERQVCLLLHGTTDRRYLLSAEKKAARIEADYSPDKCRLVLDFSGAANAVLRAVKEKARQAGEWKPQQMLFGDGKSVGLWERVGDGVHELARKVTPEGAERIWTAGVVAAFLMVGSVWGLKVGLTYELQRRQQAIEHQERIAELDHTTIIRRDGVVARETAQLKEILHEEKKVEAQKVALLSDLELEQPLIGFVAREGRRAAPIVLGLAPSTGRLSFGGMEMGAKEARGLAKLLRQVERDEDVKGGEWQTKVVRS